MFGLAVRRLHLRFSPAFAPAAVLSWLALLLLLLTACRQTDITCTDPLGCVDIAANQPVRLGYLLAQSGMAAPLGTDSMGAVEMALDARSRELLGHRLELVGIDSGCGAVDSAAAAAELVETTGLVGIIGPNCSAAAEAVIPIIHETGLTMISPSSTAPQLTDPQTARGGSWREGFARTAHSDVLQAKLAAEFAFDALDARSAAIVHDEQVYPFMGLPSQFAFTFQELGGQVILRRTVFAGQTGFTELLDDLVLMGPDVVYLAVLEPEARFILNELQDVVPLENMRIIGVDSLLEEHFIENMGVAAEGVYIAGPAPHGPAYEAFLRDWQARYGSRPPAMYHAHAYDATNILLEAVRSAAQAGGNNRLLIGRQALRDAIAATSGYRGLTGVLTCSQYGDCASGEALGIYEITTAEIAGERWPPPVIWTP